MAMNRRRKICIALAALLVVFFFILPMVLGVAMRGSVEKKIGEAVKAPVKLGSLSVNLLPPGMRGRYHAAAGYASQFINVILREASAIWQSWGANEEDAVAALLPLVQGTLASITGAGLARGMPGPVSRGDIVSIDKHLASLAALDPSLQQLYRAMCSRSIALGLEAGGINEQQAQQLRQMLGTN